jgi:hypothetical protein
MTIDQQTEEKVDAARKEIEDGPGKQNEDVDAAPLVRDNNNDNNETWQDKQDDRPDASTPPPPLPPPPSSLASPGCHDREGHVGITLS